MDNESNASNGEATASAVESQTANISSDSSRMESIDRAFDQVFNESAPAKEAPVEAKPDVNRTPDGKFAPKEAAEGTQAPVETAEAPKEQEAPKEAVSPLDEPPARFSPDAKAAWKDAPPAVRGEVARALTELENGINHYKAYGEQFRGVEQYAQMAAQGGKTLDSVLKAYVGAEQMLRSSPMQGIEHILSNIGITPQQYASAVMGVEPDMQAHQSQQVIIDLRNQVQQLQQQVGTVAQTFEQQQQAEALRTIETFKAGKPRFDELRTDMKFFMETGRAQTLDDAYTMADRLNPAPASMTQQTPVAAAPIAALSPNPSAQTRKAGLSVVGAPNAGSNPANRKAAPSREESINRAFAAVGL